MLKALKPILKKSQMLHNELVDEKAHLDAYWDSMLRCFMALHGNIVASRDKSGIEHYTTYFKDQSENDGLEYWRLHHSYSKIIYYADISKNT